MFLILQGSFHLIKRQSSSLFSFFKPCQRLCVSAESFSLVSFYTVYFTCLTNTCVYQIHWVIFTFRHSVLTFTNLFVQNTKALLQYIEAGTLCSCIFNKRSVTGVMKSIITLWFYSSKCPKVKICLTIGKTTQRKKMEF